MGHQVIAGVRRGSRAPAVTPAGERVRPVRRSGRWSLRGERGAVTAEAAMVIPVLVAIAVGLVWVVALAAAQVRVVDGAREVARVAARGDSDETAVARGRAVAPAGARFAIDRSGGQVSVAVEAEVKGPGGLFSFLPGVQVRSTALAVEEPR